MALQFKKATKKQVKLRLAFDGPSGAGKTMTALRVARGLVGPAGRIGVIDTERGSASLYSDAIPGGYDVLELADNFSPTRYVEALKAAEAEGYEVIIIDSLSHAWEGAGGALDQVDRVVARSKAGNSFTAWREVTPIHNLLVNAILQSTSHIIVTMRSKSDYVLEENEKGKKVPVKVGLAPIQRQGIDFEFSIVGDLDHEHTLVVSKTRMSGLDGQVVKFPGEDLGKQIRAWLDSGEAAEPTPTKLPEQASKAVEAPPSSPPKAPAPVKPLRQQLEEQLRAAKTEAALGAIIETVGPAVAAKTLTDADRSALIKVWASCVDAVRAAPPETAEQAMAQAKAAQATAAAVLDPVEGWAKKLREATTSEALHQVGEQIGKETLTEAQRDRLVPVWEECSDKLASGKAA